MIWSKAEALRDQKRALSLGRAPAEKQTIEALLKGMTPSEQPFFVGEADAVQAINGLAGALNQYHVVSRAWRRFVAQDGCRSAAGDVGGYRLRRDQRNCRG